MDFKACAGGKRCTTRDAREFCSRGTCIALSQSVAPSAGVNLDDGRPDRDRGFDLCRLRGNE